MAQTQKSQIDFQRSEYDIIKKQMEEVLGTIARNDAFVKETVADNDLSLKQIPEQNDGNIK